MAVPDVVRVPVAGALVRRLSDGARGVVRSVRTGNPSVQLTVGWQDRTLPALIDLRGVGSGFQAGDEVLDAPELMTKESLGHGRVVRTRMLGGMEQVLVEFWSRELQVWLPWQRVRAVAGPRMLFSVGKPPPAEGTEAFRLRNLAFALEQWNRNTGALAQLNIDPLPHQIHLTHRILASGNFNWLIADDVGLGKTIEVGLLITALKQRGFRRFLLVVPAGLTQQWQEEMAEKFSISDFLIYGRDFRVSEPAHWRQFDHVIGSVDLFKMEEHSAALAQAQPWDLVVFDEAHRLGRTEYGLKFDTSDRYRFAQSLRTTTENMLLLTGTPHQGKMDRFRALLELLRPGETWRKRFQLLEMDASVLSEMIIRNRKADVTDHSGAFIFRGKISKTIRVEPDTDEQAFERSLRGYLTNGYRSSAVGGNQALAIGFVMTTYRKLAASSLPAILRALEKRLDRLEGASDETPRSADPLVEDERFVESDERVTSAASEFFSGETAMVQALIGQARNLVHADSKARFFLDGLVDSVLSQDPTQRVLIFTEYRTTQDYLIRLLGRRFGDDKVRAIHGGMDLDQRRESVRQFEGDGQFMVSTEAGGEGLNLHRGCHILVNYDLPWNPMRLVQRVGRLYRYGQGHPVVVFNVQVEASLDDHILQRMYERLDVVAREMAVVSDEYTEGLKEDILGELAEAMDVADILEAAETYEPGHTADRIEEALRRAREAVEKQDRLLSHASGFDPDELREELALGMDHVKAFIGGMLQQLGGTVEAELHGGNVWAVHLPELMQHDLGLNQNQRLCFDRETYRRVRNVQLVAAESAVFQYLVERASRFEFGGLTARVHLEGAEAVTTCMLRWQDDRGRTLRQEYLALLRSPAGDIVVNPEDWADWLRSPSTPDPSGPVDAGAASWPAFEHEIDRRLAARSNEAIYPNSWYLVSAGWSGPRGEPAADRQDD